MQGQGQLTLTDGSYYECSWEAGQPHKGRWSSADGQTEYEGQFKGMLWDGFGTLHQTGIRKYMGKIKRKGNSVLLQQDITEKACQVKPYNQDSSHARGIVCSKQRSCRPVQHFLSVSPQNKSSVQPMQLAQPPPGLCT